MKSKDRDLIEKATKLLDLADEAKKRVKINRNYVAIWQPYSMYTKEKAQHDLRISQAAQARIWHRYEKVIEELHRRLYF